MSNSTRRSASLTPSSSIAQPVNVCSIRGVRTCTVRATQTHTHTHTHTHTRRSRCRCEHKTRTVPGGQLVSVPASESTRASCGVNPGIIRFLVILRNMAAFPPVCCVLDMLLHVYTRVRNVFTIARRSARHATMQLPQQTLSLTLSSSSVITRRDQVAAAA